MLKKGNNIDIVYKGRRSVTIGPTKTGIEMSKKIETQNNNIAD